MTRPATPRRPEHLPAGQDELESYLASLVGSDREANLALLQLSGTGFTPVAIGTTDGLSLDDRVASGGGTWTAKGVLLSTGAVTGIDVPVTLDGSRLTGLLADSALAVPGTELGGPLFNLSGQPSVSVPLHWNDTGLPIGVMLSGRMGDEATLISLSAQLEAARPWRDKHPPIRTG